MINLRRRDWLAVGAAALAFVVGSALMHGVMKPRLDKARADAVAARAGQARAELEAEGARRLAEAEAQYHQGTTRTVERTIEIRHAAAAAPDAGDPLASSRADRLRGHDQFLCGERPALCAPSGTNTRSGDGELRPVHAADSTDAGRP